MPRARLDKTDGLLSVRRKRPFPSGKRTLPSNGRFCQTPESELHDYPVNPNNKMFTCTVELQQRVRTKNFQR
jgi:hypothetical protein